MKTFHKYMKAIRYQIESGAPFCWDCYGQNARYYDALTKERTWNASMIADAVTETVFEITLTEDKNDRAWRWINPEYKKAYEAESKEKGFNWKQAWDDVEYKEVSKKKILRLIEEAFAEVKASSSRVFEVLEEKENEDGGLTISYYIDPELAQTIINNWVRNAITKESEEVIKSKTVSRELVDEEWCTSDTVETDKTTEDVSRTDWGGSFTYPHER